MRKQSERISVLIIDDEPIAREGVRLQLHKEPQAEIVAECANGMEAVEAIRELHPDLVFLDVQMPGMDGFEVLQSVGPKAMPAVVFVTAYDKYALQAFDVNAVDYLLKPFDSDRFRQSFRRAKARLRQANAEVVEQRLKALLESVRPAKNYLTRLVVKSSGRIFFLAVSEIDWIEAAGKYVSLHTGTESHLIRETLTGLEAKLDPADFVRIRHSVIVNVQRVKELSPLFKAEYQVTLLNGTKLISSRRYRRNLARLLGES